MTVAIPLPPADPPTLAAQPTLSERLARGEVLHLPARVTHARRGTIRHSFAYGVDYLLLAPETARPQPLFSRNRFNLFALHDSDHGGARGAGEGAPWARRMLAEAGLQMQPDMVLALLTQPRFLGYWFAPVSFWMVLRGNDLLAAIAEVNNTFGQRHSYLCHAPGFAPLAAADRTGADKVFHVSPFQDVAGTYDFAFALSAGRLAIRIRQIDGPNGLDAAMAGPLHAFGTGAALRAALRRPGGSLRVVALIYWNALRLKLKGAAYRRLPPLPDREIT